MKERFIAILTLAVCAASFLWLSKALILGYYPDFQTQYYATIQSFTNANPYSSSDKLFTSQVYPPTTSFFYLSFVLVPIKISSIIFSTLSLASLVFVFVLLSKTFSISFFSKTNLIFMTLAFTAFPTKFTLGMGQINIFILLLLTLSLFLYKRRQELLSGIFISLSVLIKLFPLPIVPLLFMSKKIFLGVVVGALLLFFLTLVFIPFSNTQYFLSHVLPTLLSGWKLDYYNQSLSGFLGRGWEVNGITMTIKNLLTLLILGISYFAILKNKKKDIHTFALQFGTIITASLIINTFSWQHHFVWLIIPFYTTTLLVQKMKSRALLFLLLVSYILIALNSKEPNSLPILFQSHVLYGSMIILILQLKLLLTGRKMNG